jgi:N-glycosidase YbiA
MNKITSFSGEFDFLSNFYPCKIEFEDEVYPSVEHAFQAAKTTSPSARQKILEAGTSGKAKQIGRTVPLRPYWDLSKITYMREFLRQKFEKPELRNALLATGDAEIIEGNNWNDTFWGVCKGKGLNHLGKLLMEIRSKILSETSA